MLRRARREAARTPPAAPPETDGPETADRRAALRAALDALAPQDRALVWGQVVEGLSYRELAAQVGSPRAFQAVGQANGRNPLPILIPCHRVIAADGTLGGYSSGVERKRFLLRLEGLSIPESKPPRRVGKRGVRAR